MKTLFLRLYLGILGSVLLVLPLAAILVWEQYRGTEEMRAEQHLRFTARTMASALAAVPPDRQDPLRERLAAQAGMEIALLPLDTLPEDLRTRVSRGETVASMGSAGENHVYQAVDGAQAVSLIVPALSLRYTANPLGTATLMLAALGLGVYFHVRPLERQLRQLAHAAERFGAGQLDARARSAEPGPVGELARSFDQMADRIQRNLDEQRDLLRAVSHELRTPLARLRFSMALLAREDEASRRAALAEGADRHLAELDGLVEDLLSWARLEHSVAALTRAPVAAARLLGSLQEDLAERDERIRVRLGPVDGVIQADLRLLRRALDNLGNNALRYARAAVVLSCQPADGGLLLSVDDDGPGVPVADRVRVFEPFVRLDPARDSDAGGVGLGLAIVARIAALHGGRADVVDSALGGACFRVWVPEQAD